MTKEEALYELERCKSLIKQNGKDWLDERDIPVLDIAFEAVKARLTEEGATKGTIASPLLVFCDMDDCDMCELGLCKAEKIIINSEGFCDMYGAKEP